MEVEENSLLASADPGRSMMSPTVIDIISVLYASSEVAGQSLAEIMKA
jgi:hypothetical protein